MLYESKTGMGLLAKILTKAVYTGIHRISNLKQLYVGVIPGSVSMTVVLLQSRRLCYVKHGHGQRQYVLRVPCLTG